MRLHSRLILLLLLLMTHGEILAQQGQGNGFVLGPLPALNDARKEITSSRNLLSGKFSNSTKTDKESLIMSYYESDPKMQYGRRVWIPSESQMSFFYSMGPLEGFGKNTSVDIQSILYDITDGQKEVIKTKEGAAFFSSKVRVAGRGARLALIGHSSDEISPPVPRYLRELSERTELESFIRLIRASQIKPLHYETISSGILPASEDAYEGLDYLVIAGNQMEYDAAGCRALRNWIEMDGGKVWILVDRVSESTINSLFGETVLYQEIERTLLNQVEFKSGLSNDENETEAAEHHEDPVEFVKVLTDPNDVIFMVNDWPAAFTKKFGNGSALFTTLGTRGWTRKLKIDEEHPFRKNDDIPVPTSSMRKLIYDWSTSSNDKAFEVKNLQKTLEEQIGHSIISRSKVISILGIFCGSLFVIGIVLKLFKKSSYLGIVGPVISIGVSIFFFNYGLNATQSIPPTIATYQFANVVEETNDISMSGLISVYYPTSYNGIVGVKRGGRIQFDQVVEADGARIIQTDLDSWVFEDIQMRRGVQTASFEQVQTLSKPLKANITFGPEGLAGKIDTNLFSKFEDAIILTPQTRRLRVDMAPDGQFKASPDDVLEGNVFIKTDFNLSSDQQRHSSIYSEYLNILNSKDSDDKNKTTIPKALQGRNFLLTWATPIDTNFELQKGAQLVGASLLAIPLSYQKSGSGTQVSIPATLIPYRSVEAKGIGQKRSSAYFNKKREWNSVSIAANTRLRFQMPKSLLPLKLDRVKLTVKIKAPSRTVTIEGLQGEQKTILHTVNSPIETVTFEIDQKDNGVLSLDDQGGLLLEINVGDTTDLDSTGNKLSWKIDFVELTAFGTTQE